MSEHISIENANQQMEKRMDESENRIEDVNWEEHCGYILNKTYKYIIEDYSFGGLPKEKLKKIYKDGRVFSHLAEQFVPEKFPALVHVSGCKNHDFYNKYNNTKLDEKTFTMGGCKFMPSHMIGTGRKFEKNKFEEHCNKLTFCIVSNVNFPEIKIRFEKGSELIKKFPKGVISIKKHDEFFDV
jgi:hypothetical protein